MKGYVALKKSMKILLVVHQTLPYCIGGVECLTHDLALGLKDAGHHPLVFSKIFEGVAPVVSTVEDCNFYMRLPILFDRRLKNEFANEAVLLAFKKVIEEFCPDLVHIMHLQHMHFGIAKIVKEKNIPLVTSVFDYWYFCRKVQRLCFNGTICDVNIPGLCQECNVPLRFQLAYLNRNAVFRLLYRHLGFLIGESRGTYERRKKALAGILENSDVVCFATNALRSFHEKHYKIKKVMMIPYGIREPIKKNMRFDGATERELTFGFIGTCAPHKGVLQLIDAFLEFGKTRCKLILYLNDAQHPGYSKLVHEKAAVNSSIHIREPFPFEQIYERLQEFDALVIPSIWDENMPLVLLAALNQHVPVLGSRVAGIGEFVQTGKTGWLFTPNDKKTLVEAMGFYVDQVRTGWVPRFGDGSPFSIKKYVEDNLKIYSQLGDSTCVGFVD